MIICGIDEAALGPRLGPFCACLTGFSVQPLGSETPDLYKLLSQAISNNPADGTKRINICDSKQIYSHSKGLERLESSIFIILKATGYTQPANLHELIQTFCPPEDYQNMTQSPWFQQTGPDIPLSNINIGDIYKQTETLCSVMQNNGVVMDKPYIRFITAKSFNQALTENRNKAIAIQTMLSPMIKKAISTRNRSVRLTVDRQGGRKYYSQWLTANLPGHMVKIIRETSQASTYELEGNYIEFLVSADQKQLETALASMFAKYVREVAMFSFNLWWQKRIKGLRPTAGYPQDASRFINDIDAAGKMSANSDILIRHR